MKNVWKRVAVLASISLLTTPAISLLEVEQPVQEVHAATSTQTTAIAKQIMLELNNLRSQNGLSKVTVALQLNNLAQSRANHLANIGRLDQHSGYNYTAGAPYTAVAGENIGYWYNSAIHDPKTIAKQIIRQLYDDQGVADYGHRKNMLNPYFAHVGIGVSIDPANNYVFYAQDFGTTSNELGNNYQKAKAYAQYTQQNGLSSQYPSVYNENDNTASVLAQATKISGVVTTSNLTHLYDRPNGKLSNRSLAKSTAWYTDYTFVDGYGNHWYRVSTSEWAPINNNSFYPVNK